mgnify:CR=1 FL=1
MVASHHADTAMTNGALSGSEKFGTLPFERANFLQAPNRARQPEHELWRM